MTTTLAAIHIHPVKSCAPLALETVYFGGGTPTLLSRSVLARLLPAARGACVQAEVGRACGGRRRKPGAAGRP